MCAAALVVLWLLVTAAAALAGVILFWL